MCVLLFLTFRKKGQRVAVGVSVDAQLAVFEITAARRYAVEIYRLGSDLPAVLPGVFVAARRLLFYGACHECGKTARTAATTAMTFFRLLRFILFVPLTRRCVIRFCLCDWHRYCADCFRSFSFVVIFSYTTAFFYGKMIIVHMDPPVVFFVAS